MSTKIYVASAGTGKTTTLMDELTKCLEDTPPNRICFTTFTKAAAQEAIDRALAKHPAYSHQDFTAFSTLHALCFRRIPRKQMLNYQDYKLLG
jgi:ATP-dependent exoDNAse (exonuclease V) beta subunit